LYGSSGPSHSNLSCRSSSKAMLTGLAMAVATRVLVPPASTIWRARRAATTTKVYLLSAFSSRASRSSCMGLSLQPEEMTGVQVALDPASLGSDDGCHVGRGNSHIIVYYTVLVIFDPHQFLAGAPQALPLGFRRLGAPALDAAAQFLQGRRQDEDGHRLGVKSHDLAGSLDVLFHDDIPAFPYIGLHGLPGCAVQVAVHFGPFHQFAPGGPGPEILFIGEEIMLPIPLARTGRPGGHADAVDEIGFQLGQFPAHRTLAGARGRRQHDEQARQGLVQRRPPPFPSPSAVRPNSRGARRWAMVSGWTAASSTWPESVMMTARVRRP